MTSGCFRPHLSDDTNQKSTENSLVGALSPVMLSVSEKAYDSFEPGYAADLYCKWKVKAVQGSKLVAEVVDADVFPLASSCAIDGFVLLENEGTLYEAVHGN